MKRTTKMSRYSLWTSVISISLLFASCNSYDSTESIEKWKQEILLTERHFAQMADEEGIKKAFSTFAASDAVLMRSNKLIKGKEAIGRVYDNDFYEAADLDWLPDFVDVSSAGDLGYTYGKYTFSYTDSIGNPVEQQGIFHTVWKRQDDGTWRFVWD